MVRRGQGQPRAASRERPALADKKKPHRLLTEIEALWAQCGNAFDQERSWFRARSLLLGHMVCLGRHTITGLLGACGRQFGDWSSDYRVFSEPRFDPQEVFGAIRRGVLDFLKPGEPMVVAMDDSIVRKTGRRIPGVQYYRDPLGPPFRVNLARAERVLQLSAALPPGGGEGPCRMVPVDFLRAPRLCKPSKTAPPEAWEAYRRQARESRVNHRGAQRLAVLRDQLDQDGPRGQRPLWAVVDGRFTNKPVFNGLPPRTALIGRIRGDATLYHPPSAPLPGQPGRHRVYGDRAPTPEALRQDEAIPWQTARVWAAGKFHDFRVKTLAPLRWRSAGEKHALRLIVIAPLGYRPRKGSKILYRRPAYLICTDPSLPLEKILQAYVWRWDIEVNFRDEKQLLGLGEAQVRSEASVEAAPSLAVAAYAMLLLAAARAFGVNGTPGALPPPKWRTRREKPRAATNDLIQHLRCELWAQTLAVPDFSGFMHSRPSDHNAEKSTPDLASAIFYAVG